MLAHMSPALSQRAYHLRDLARLAELVIVLQVHADFECIGRAAGLSTLCVYGGTQYQPQEQTLRRGCDVVVGTPGRMKDHLERGTLKLQEVAYVSQSFTDCTHLRNHLG
jgi:hypothetical protein